MKSINELEELANLFKQGLISKEEFDSLKAEIINNPSSVKQTNPISQSVNNGTTIADTNLSESHEANGNSHYSTGYYVGKNIGRFKSKYPQFFALILIVIIMTVIKVNYNRYSQLLTSDETRHSNSGKSSDNTINSNGSNNPNSNETYEDKIKRLVKDRISNRTFISEEHSLYTVIRFEPVDEQAFGAMILSQNHCNYSFSYDINGNRIDTKFVTSDCGGSSRNATLYYIEKNDWITTNIEGQMFIFK
jgi:hypothetical protein